MIGRIVHNYKAFWGQNWFYSHQWTSDSIFKNRKIPLSKGQRFVVLHAGCENGFLPGCDLVFKSISTDGRDYHTEMNAKIFEKWVKEQLIFHVLFFSGTHLLCILGAVFGS
jgi:hypothetical protein